QRTVTHTDVAVFNGGAVRSEQYYPPQDFTWADILTMLPFGNKVAVLQTNGTLLKAILEHSASRRPQEPLWGGWLHVSGIEVKYDLTQPVNHRVVSLKFAPQHAKHPGQIIHPETPFTLSLSQYMLEGGNGYAMVKAYAKNFPERVTLREEDDATVLKTYWLTYPNGVSPHVEGRVTW
ncbi:MAG: 5'-nucleotidase C-terminal domain-containing protein, partial [Vampirovibrionales bacterium]